MALTIKEQIDEKTYNIQTKCIKLRKLQEIFFSNTIDVAGFEVPLTQTMKDQIKARALIITTSLITEAEELQVLLGGE